MSRYLSHLAALTLHQVEPVQPRLASRFETPVDMGPADGNRLDAVQELHVQPSTVTPTESPVAQKIVTAPVNVQPKQEHNPPKIVEHTEFIINKPESPADLPKPSPVQGMAAFDTKPNTEQSNRTALPVDKPVVQTSYGIRKDALPPESKHTLVEQTIRIERVTTEVAASGANPKSVKLEESQHPAPVKPASIVTRPEPSPAGPNTVSQTGIRSLPSDTDAAPAPTVQVTIGRIEIRATQVADKPSVKAHSANTAMSLDDYLKQRNGGKA